MYKTKSQYEKSVSYESGRLFPASGNGGYIDDKKATRAADRDMTETIPYWCRDELGESRRS